MNSLFDDFKNSFIKRDNGLSKIILLNVSVFLFLAIVSVISWVSKSQFYHTYVITNFSIPAQWLWFLHKPWTLITYFFTHEDIFHILFNMLGLYWFGRIIDEFLGNRRVINLYILGGLAGAFIYLLFYNTIPYFKEMADAVYTHTGHPLSMLGASASVFAIVVAAATLVPEYRFNLLFIGPVKIVYIAAFYVVVSFLGVKGDNAGGNLAHLGGALIGFIYIKQLQRGTDLGKPISIISNWFNNIGKPKLKVYSNKTKEMKSQISQKDIDAILDKISRSGYESLSKEEKEKLFKASQK
jgi:membrane associated rhomboid family serine protease